MRAFRWLSAFCSVAPLSASPSSSFLPMYRLLHLYAYMSVEPGWPCADKQVCRTCDRSYLGLPSRPSARRAGAARPCSHWLSPSTTFLVSVCSRALMPEGLAVGVAFGSIGQAPAATFANARLAFNLMTEESFHSLLSYHFFYFACLLFRAHIAAISRLPSGCKTSLRAWLSAFRCIAPASPRPVPSCTHICLLVLSHGGMASSAAVSSRLRACSGRCS